MLVFVGLGLGDAKDITVKGLEVVKKAKKVFLEGYTSILSCGKEELEAFYGRTDLVVAGRDMVETGYEAILEDAKDDLVAFLVVGDPFGATTHTSLMGSAKEKGIPVKTVHNASIMNAIGCCGLQLYSYGQTVSIPLWIEGNVQSESFFDKIEENLQMGLHTLCLLDIKIGERTVENMMKNREIYEPPKFMSVSEAVSQLLTIAQRRPDSRLTEQSLAIGVARVGHDDQTIVADTLQNLATVDMGKPLHSLVIPGHMHFVEEEAVNMWKKS